MKVLQMKRPDQHEKLVKAVGSTRPEVDQAGQPGRIHGWVLVVEREDEQGQRWITTSESGGVYRREIVGMLVDAAFGQLSRLNESLGVGRFEDVPDPEDDGAA